jgi:hypothetical protein
METRNRIVAAGTTLCGSSPIRHSSHPRQAVRPTRHELRAARAAKNHFAAS